MWLLVPWQFWIFWATVSLMPTLKWTGTWLTFVTSMAAAGCTSTGGEETPFSRCPDGSDLVNGQCVALAGQGLNTVGYLPGRVKRATLHAASSAFEVRRADDDSVALEGEVTGPFYSEDVRRDVWVADFSALEEAGKYYLVAEGAVPSPTFKVRSDVYESVFDALMLGMYGQRCGVEVSFEWGGEAFHHGACHTDPASLEKAGLSGARDATLGWHDAGDYGKYTVNAGFSTGLMLLAFEHFTDRLSARELEIPESGDDVPDFLDEVRFNLEWMLKMQHEDGSVAHKLDTFAFADFVMPTMDRVEQYFSDWGSAATANFAAVAARAARTYAPYDPAFAELCGAAAQASFDFVLENPSKDPDLSSFAEQQYRTGAEDDLCWAACEMWELTGETVALEACESRIATSRFTDNWDWSDVRNLCMVTYATSSRGDSDRRDPVVLEAAVSSIIQSADRLVENADQDPYGLGYVGGRYWGINGIYARSVVNLQTAYRIEPKEVYLDAATQQVDHLLGRNYFGRSQVTGLGYLPPRHPHHRPSEADGTVSAWPGLLVGGGNLSREEREREDAPPPGTSWVDSVQSFQTNEVAINWNAALIYAVAGFVE